MFQQYLIINNAGNYLQNKHIYINNLVSFHKCLPFKNYTITKTSNNQVILQVRSISNYKNTNEGNFSLVINLTDHSKLIETIFMKIQTKMFLETKFKLLGKGSQFVFLIFPYYYYCFIDLNLKAS